MTVPPARVVLPPATRTWPFDSATALCPHRGTVIGCWVAVQLPAAGSYSSAVASAGPDAPPRPPVVARVGVGVVLAVGPFAVAVRSGSWQVALGGGSEFGRIGSGRGRAGQRQAAHGKHPAVGQVHGRDIPPAGAQRAGGPPRAG